MSAHPDLQPQRTEALRAALGARDEGCEPAPPPAASAPRRGLRARVRAAAGRLLRPLARPVLDALAERVARRVRANLRTEQDRLALDVELLRAQLDALWPSGHALEGLGGVAELVAATGADALQHLHGFEVNQELLKAELATFHQTLEELGRAIAPGTGLDGMPRQFAELRQQLNALDRRVRAAIAPAPAVTVGEAAVAAPQPAMSTFDYVGFERRFRGDSEEILTRTMDRYLDLLLARQPVLDVGCGRGELLAGLAARGIAGAGVDLDPEMVAEARARGVDARTGDAIAFLRALPPGSYGAITAIQVVEHLRIEETVTLLDLAASRLRPGGVFIAETPNPTSMIVLSRSYILDPTHVWPLHPSLMTFLCERAGFLTVEERFFSPAEELYLPLLDEPDDAPFWVPAVNEAFRRLNRVLFGPQDYAVIATAGETADPR